MYDKTNPLSLTKHLFKEGSLTQLDYCHQNKDTAIACCTCVFYHQSSNPNECDKPCPPDYYTIFDNKYLCKEEQPTSTAIPTTNLNPTTPKVPDSYYCIRQCASGEYYDKRLLKCQTCPTHCLECNDEKNCTTCYVKHENECLQECPEGSIMCKESETVSQSEIIAIGSAVGVVVLLVGFAIVIVKLKRRTAGRTQRDSINNVYILLGFCFKPRHCVILIFGLFRILTENEKQDMKADKKQENADGDDSTNPPPLPKRLEKSKTEVEEKDGNVQDEICIIPTSLRRCNKIVIDGNVYMYLDKMKHK
ncbi:hypothetical protein MAR_005109 [Mya arenaria]|uniref:TNFR-Cys domain-containing protein n=1 Tax=Mya arenaria TaxID=6604 RepID=A0ABY7F2J5_MYAAR|nr:hypothetical protein MAR_005109 [Mya arenaria]